LKLHRSEVALQRFSVEWQCVVLTGLVLHFHQIWHALDREQVAIAVAQSFAQDSQQSRVAHVKLAVSKVGCNTSRSVKQYRGFGWSHSPSCGCMLLPYRIYLVAVDSSLGGDEGLDEIASMVEEPVATMC
jgi:hypothetical protein